jgi:signal transduction histidine kinase
VLGLVFCTITVLGVVFSVVVLRADPRRWDNRLFAILGVLDAITTTDRGIAMLGGQSIANQDTLALGNLLAYPIVWATIEFAYAFPFGRPAPMRLRVPVVAAAALGLALAIIPATRTFCRDFCTYYYFTPLLVLTVVLVVRNLRRAKGDRTSLFLVAAAMVGRWAAEIIAFGVVLQFAPEYFAPFLFFDATGAVLLSYVVITFAVLRSQLFSVRGLASEVIALGGIGVAILALAAVGVEAAFRAAKGPLALHTALVFVSLIPLGLATAGRRLRGPFERAVLRIDPRRALRESVVERVQDARDGDPTALLGRIEKALVELTGGEVVYLRAKDLPPELAEALKATTAHLLRGAAPGVAYDLVVPVRSGDTLHGALAMTGGIVDRDTLVAATTLADRLALRLDAFTMFAELEASRRLATLGSFAAAIAHDIRTPLTSVQMNVQILRSKARLPADDMEYFDIALEELKRLNGSISELLDFAKPAQTKIAPFDVGDVIADAARASESILAESKLSLVTRRGDGTPLAQGDARQLRQVLVNLITNAASASKADGRIEVGTRCLDDGRVAVDVRDEGRGIAPSDLPHIFEPFFTTRADGTGLGLAICQKLVVAQGGEIRVETAEGRGTTFTVVLPAAEAKPKADRAPKDSHDSLPA